jgi:flavin reductase (DIM6/NTAB) family NADH-FMN oxidoreductase RutF
MSDANRLTPSGYFSLPQWQPLCAVGSHGAEGTINAQICISITSASIVPDRPRLLVTLWKQNLTHDLVASTGSLSISLMHAGQVNLVSPLGLETGRRGPKLVDVPTALTAAGDPYLLDAVGFADCVVADCLALGDATTFLVLVRHEERLLQAEPVTWGRAAELLPRDVMERYDAKFGSDVALARDTMSWFNDGTTPNAESRT